MKFPTISQNFVKNPKHDLHSAVKFPNAPVFPFRERSLDFGSRTPFFRWKTGGFPYYFGWKSWNSFLVYNVLELSPEIKLFNEAKQSPPRQLSFQPHIFSTSVLQLYLFFSSF